MILIKESRDDTKISPLASSINAVESGFDKCESPTSLHTFVHVSP